MTKPFTPAELDAIRVAAEAATPGPWRWELNEKSKRVALQGGKPKYDCTVMDFVRYGMNGAMPRFVTEPKPFMNIMKPCTAYAKEVEGRKHHADWFKTIDNQDANYIAMMSPSTVLRLVEQARPMEWQPIIENGKYEDVLLYFPPVFACQSLIRSGRIADCGYRKPSHWMPIPKPPETK
jgi:hypothetical protein